MSIKEQIKELGDKLLSGKITPEEHVREYNILIEKESSNAKALGWQPHEHI